LPIPLDLAREGQRPAKLILRRDMCYYSLSKKADLFSAAADAAMKEAFRLQINQID
jgi:hypothetical protein